MKKYLKSVEDIEALRNTDTKIYSSGSDGYYQFIKDVFCFIHSDGDIYYNIDIGLDGTQYIEVPEKPDESWIGKLGWVSDESKDKKTRCGVLVEYLEEHQHPYKIQGGLSWTYFTPLTPEEVEKYTDYKVVKEI